MAGLNRNSSWVTLLAREVFEKNLNYLEVVNILSQTKLLAPVYYIIAGPQQFQVNFIKAYKIDHIK